MRAITPHFPSTERRCSLSHEQFGILAFCIVTASILPYVWKIAGGKADTSVTGWAISTVTGFVTFLTYGGIGATDNIWIAALELVDPALVVIAAVIGRNRWEKPSRYDASAVLLAIVALSLHIVSHRNGMEQIAYWSAIAADLCGATQVVLFAWRRPQDEQPVPWAISIIGTILSFWSIENFSIGQTSLPVYQLVFCSLIFFPAVRYRVRKRTLSRRHP